MSEQRLIVRMTPSHCNTNLSNMKILTMLLVVIKLTQKEVLTLKLQVLVVTDVNCGFRPKQSHLRRPARKIALPLILHRLIYPKPRRAQQSRF